MITAARDSSIPQVVRQTRAGRVATVAGLAAIAVLASLPVWAGAGTQKLLVEFLTLLALAQMWNLLAGFAGLVSIGQQAFIGLGAYVTVVALDRMGIPPIVALGLIAVVALAVSLVTSVFVFRLAGGYFAIGMWVVAEVFRILVTNTRELGAGTGLSIRSLNSMTPTDRQALVYWLALVVGAGSIIVVALIMRSRLGLALRAVRDGAPAASSLGVDVGRTRFVIFLVAAVGSALAGAVIYMQLLRIQPTAAFGVDWTAKIIFIVIIGGLGRIEGPIVGAIVYFLLRELLADQGSLYLVILGMTAIALTLLAPTGLWGLVTNRFPVALFGIERRLIIGSGEAAPSTTNTRGNEGQ